MIASLSGKIISISTDSLIIDVQGVGFEVSVPRPLLSNLEVGEPVALYTYLVVREDLLALYGFTSPDEKKLFLDFLGVDGVGPRLALAILSNISMDNIRRAVITEQPDFFARVPGIGKKTAQKILIHMQGKITGEISTDLSRKSSAADDEVLDALIGLGYSVVEAQTAVQALPKGTPDTTEEKLRLALQYFDH